MTGITFLLALCVSHEREPGISESKVNFVQEKGKTFIQTFIHAHIDAMISGGN